MARAGGSASGGRWWGGHRPGPFERPDRPCEDTDRAVGRGGRQAPKALQRTRKEVHIVDRIVRSRTDLEEACRDAQPGDVILVHARSYPGIRPATLKKVRATPDHPVVIRAADD